MPNDGLDVGLPGGGHDFFFLRAAASFWLS
jgi:hypothetical protein